MVWALLDQVPAGRAHYLRAFRDNGLVVRERLEPRFDAAQVELQGLANAPVPDAAIAAFLAFPGALVWDLVRSTA